MKNIIILLFFVLLFPMFLFASNYENYYQIPSIKLGQYKLDFIPDTSEAGNAGCTYLIKIIGPSGDKNFKVFFHPKAYKILYDKGYNNVILVSYHRMGSENDKFCGYLKFENLDYATGSVLKMSESKIYPQDDHKIIYDKLFGVGSKGSNGDGNNVEE